jgi:hypothetical protein
MDGFEVTDVIGARVNCVTDVWFRSDSEAPEWGVS